MIASKLARAETAIALIALATASSAGGARAQTATLVPFNQFVQQLSSAQSAAFVGPGLAANVAAFGEMRAHALSLYTGVQVKHSFLMDDHPYDCVPMAQQPSVRLSDDKTIAEPPPDMPELQLDSAADADLPNDAELTAQVDATNTKDALGNSTVCEDGTIPMWRVTLADMSRFGTLRQFFQKGPGGAGQAPAPLGPDAPEAPAVPYTHKYAHSYEFVGNIGGFAVFSIWNPVVNTNQHEIFSLEQNWYTNNTRNNLQTLENGVQVFPQMYRTRKAALFIYWTADGYNRTGCYNLMCKGFVQTNKNVYLGGTFPHYSYDGGPPRVISLQNYHYKNRWYIYLNGTTSKKIIGYYPDSVYRGGTMATVGANEIDYGGETVGQTIWPQMGSGRFPSTGYKHASFVKDITYFADAKHAYKGHLTRDQPSPTCYKDITTNGGRSKSSNTHFFFGGPGGRGCR